MPESLRRTFDQADEAPRWPAQRRYTERAISPSGEEGRRATRRDHRLASLGFRPGTLGRVPAEAIAARDYAVLIVLAQPSSVAARDFGGELGAVGQVELGVDGVQVDLGGPRRDEELG